MQLRVVFTMMLGQSSHSSEVVEPLGVASFCASGFMMFVIGRAVSLLPGVTLLE
jgi:hypothetical protein